MIVIVIYVYVGAFAELTRGQRLMDRLWNR